MSSARCLNWSRPPPGRHPAPVLRKQLSCADRPVSSPSPLAAPSAGRSQSVTSAAADTDYCHFLVTGAIIHSNRLQTYHTYNQAHRGASASLVRTRPSPHVDASDGARQQQHRRPSSASASSAGGGLSGTLAGDEERPTVGRAGRRAILCKQLSLDRSILVASSIASGMATVASGGTIPLSGVGGDRDDLTGDGWAFARKQQQQQRQEQRTGAGTRNDTDAKKSLKSTKDSRINIKIFLGQTVQQDSSDTGISDTEGTTPTAIAALQQQQGGNRPIAPSPKQEPSSPSMVSTDTPPGAGKCKPTNGTAAGNGAPNAASTGTGASNANAGTGTGSGGRSSSLAQRRAQFQANRQNSEAHDRRHPPLVRAMSAPIRPADTDASKFLQGKKKPRRRKVLREKDEYNICEEDEFSDEGGAGTAQPTTGPNGRQVPGCILPMRSRSVLGGPCDIETLVSLLSSGGSDSEKEQDAAQPSPGQQSPTVPHGTPAANFRAQFASAHLQAKGPRAPMLKKAGKSVSFQESDLKPVVATAGLNRDYRKPSFQPSTVASRIRRTQQLVSTLNAFQLNKDRSAGKDTTDKQHTDTADNSDSDQLDDGATPTAEATPISATNVGSSKAPDTAKTTNGAAATNASATNGDLQTPKEQECYRLFLKMSKKGLAVSYDTILRGMLTPTELRVLQKKQSRQQSTGSGTGGESSPENGPPSVSIEEFQFQPTGGETTVHGTIPEEPPLTEAQDTEHTELQEQNAF
ncbi:uncharacterized protein LOC121593245 isoform X1 [Anopheles merus]|uniref:Uncharacterized protein n=1 Tax=Anopheles merus TaxID=30066 RepID=A0A182VCE7_ANOME|nr:uncharacterized protein LOC121593245 isoform X1 [Anopheles merus]